MMPDFNDVMKEVAEISRQQIAKGEAQLTELRKDPIKNADKIKFIETAMGADRAITKNCDVREINAIFI